MSEYTTDDMRKMLMAWRPPDAIVRRFVVEYDIGRNRYQIVIDAYDIEAAKRQFHRDEPKANMIAIWPP